MRREAEIRARANTAFYGPRNIEHEIEQKVNTACTTDPLWKGAVADHQWFMQKANMYGSMAQTEMLSALVAEIKHG